MRDTGSISASIEDGLGPHYIGPERRSIGHHAERW